MTKLSARLYLWLALIDLLTGLYCAITQDYKWAIAEFSLAVLFVILANVWKDE